MCFMQDESSAATQAHSLTINDVCVFFYQVNTKDDAVLGRLAQPQSEQKLVDEIVRYNVPCDALRGAQQLMLHIHPFRPPVEALANRVLTAAMDRVCRAA